MAERSAHEREARLVALRREAEANGRVEGGGVRPAGSPFPVASPETGYYKQPMLKPPQWTQLIPFYFFVGGAAGSLGVIGSLADVLGSETRMAKQARWLAFGGSVLSGVLLVVDLGKPQRFLNMLRVFKPQSTMSVGSWILTGFSLSASASSFADVLQQFFGKALPIQAISLTGRIGSTLFGMPFHNYTGVLIGSTVIPVWNERVGSLPGHFGMSGLQSGTSVLELMGNEDSRALNLLGLFSAAMEAWEQIDISKSKSRALQPLRTGRTGAMVQAGALLSGPLPLLLRLAACLPGAHKTLRRIAACCGILGSLCTRYGWVEAGKVSAQDWRLPLEIDAPDAAKQPASAFEG